MSAEKSALMKEEGPPHQTPSTFTQLERFFYAIALRMRIQENLAGNDNKKRKQEPEHCENPPAATKAVQRLRVEWRRAAA